MTSDTNLLTFKAISTFVTELAENFGKKQRSLCLYARLIEQTTILHEKPIQKHIDAFKKFCVENRDAIQSKDVSLLKYNEIVYSDNARINMKDVFSYADTEETGVIWSHILTISAFVDPAGKAKDILKKSLDTMKTGDTNTPNDSETKFIADIIDKVEQNVDPNADPMTAVSSIMNSGVFTDLIGGMQNGLENGNLDISRLMGTVTSMVSKMGGEEGANVQGMDMLSSMMGNMMANSLGDESDSTGDMDKLLKNNSK